MTTQQLEVDIPFASRDRLRRQAVLPTYKQYFLCDRHYDSLIRGKPGTAYVIGPNHVYDPDKDERTRRKIGLATAG
jgi:hypothetical protein